MELSNDDENFIETLVLNYEQAVSSVSVVPGDTIPNTTTALLNVSEIPVRRLINYLKLNNDFKCLTESLRVILLKNRMIEMLLVHSGLAYNLESNSFHEPGTPSLPFNVNTLSTVYGEENFENIMQISKSLFELCENNLTIIKILILLSLYYYYNENTTSLDQTQLLIVNELKAKYLKIFEGYVCKCFGIEQGKIKVSNVGPLLDRIRLMADKLRLLLHNQLDSLNISSLMKVLLMVSDESSSNTNQQTASNIN